MSGHDDSLRGSETRLWQLVRQRIRNPERSDDIDRRIWDLFGEKWCIMFTDLSGFSRHVAEFGIIHFLQVIQEQKDLLLPIVADHDGILIKIEADSFLIVFRRPDRALACTVAMQHACQKTSAGRAPEDRILLCVGLGVGNILKIGDIDVYGKEVNAASKLGEDTAESDEILVTEAFKEAIFDYPGVGFEEIDEKIPGTDRAFRVKYSHYRGSEPDRG